MRFVKSDKAVTTKHAKLGNISIDVETPQVDSLDEFVQFCGGADNALAFVNSQIETNAKNGGRAALRNLPEDANLAEATPRIQGIVKEYSPSAGGSRGPSVKAKAATLDRVTEALQSGKEFSREELLAMLSAAK